MDRRPVLRTAILRAGFYVAHPFTNKEIAMNQTFKVQGMTCEHCVQAVQKAILKSDNTAKVQVDLPTGLVSIASSQPRSALVAAIEEAGYTVGSP